MSEKWFGDATYRISTSEDTVKLDPDTYCPFQELDIKLKIFYEAQHDGRPFEDEHETRLMGEIMDDIGIRVKEIVHRLNPLGIPRK